MVACTGLLATICWSARQTRKGAAEPSDSSAEIWLVWVIAQYIDIRLYITLSHIEKRERKMNKIFLIEAKNAVISHSTYNFSNNKQGISNCFHPHFSSYKDLHQ